MSVDETPKHNDNKSQELDPIPTGEGENIKIDKRDMVWRRLGNCGHALVPDFTDETDTYIALVCAKGCGWGTLMTKDDKKFMKWVEEARSTS